MSDRAYLRDVQDRDETNLNARSTLHERFSVTNRRRAIAEFEEVLKPDGVLYAVIIGMSTGRPLDLDALRRDVGALIERDGCYRVSKATACS